MGDDKQTAVVAVKMLKESANMEQKQALIAELKILIHLGRHVNIVNLLAACTVGLMRGELLVIVEYCCYGSLRDHLIRNKDMFVNQIDPATGRIDTNIKTVQVNQYENVIKSPETSSHRYANDYVTSSSISYTTMNEGDEATVKIIHPGLRQTSHASCVRRSTVTTSDLICMSFQVARGMEYLSNRNLIHRDLAARNVLLAECNIIKICDFGLAKECKYDGYVKRGEGPMPIKWMAVESIIDKLFNVKTDIWSFAVTCWELFSLGADPYDGMRVDLDFVNRIQEGFRMSKPSTCPVVYFWNQVITRCWDIDANRRPDFSELSHLLGQFLESGVRDYYVDLNDPYERMNNEMNDNEDYIMMRNSSEGYTSMDLINEQLANRVQTLMRKQKSAVVTQAREKQIVPTTWVTRTCQESWRIEVKDERHCKPQTIHVFEMAHRYVLRI